MIRLQEENPTVTRKEPNMTGKTYEEIAREEIKENSQDELYPDADSFEWFTAIFLIDYEQALSNPDTTEAKFVNAYAYKARAEQQGASVAHLDAEGYRLRQEWAKRYDDMHMQAVMRES
jgi:hypothetical protein